MVSENIVKEVFEIQSEQAFGKIALQLFQIHAQHNEVYREFLRYIHCSPDKITDVADIPFLPIQFFKTRKVILDSKAGHKLIFKSSGTTGQDRSQHFVNNPNVYIKSFTEGFEKFYGSPTDYHIIGLLPSYMEQGDSSLIYMVKNLIDQSKSQHSGFFLDDFKQLSETLKAIENDSRKIILFGVTYALLNYAENGGYVPNDIIIMETGGMKGRRKEITKSQMYDLLKSTWNLKTIHSEYGMTELLSQAYSKADNLFSTPPWMKAFIKNPNDYQETFAEGKTGGINIIDLANIYSCPFIATQDLGKIYADGKFEVLGRFDHSDLRGCNLLVQ